MSANSGQSESHQYLECGEASRVMAMLVNLGAEVFMLKAQNERLARTLQSANALHTQATDADPDGDYAEWLSVERDSFVRSLMAPIMPSASDLVQANPRYLNQWVEGLVQTASSP